MASFIETTLSQSLYKLNKLFCIHFVDGIMSPKTSLWRVTTSDPGYRVFDYNWTVEAVSGGDTHLNLQRQAGSQFILHTPGLDPNAGNVSFEWAEQPDHYVIAENGDIGVKAFSNTSEFSK
jgi:hypothetical protein